MYRESNNKMPEQSIAFAALIAVSAIWGIHGVIGKSIGNHIAPFPVTLWRFTFLSALFLPWIANLRCVMRLGIPLLLQTLVSGVCFTFLFPLSFYESLRVLPPVTALMLLNTAPFFAALLERCCFKQKMSMRSFVGMCVSFLGAAVLIFDQWSHSASMYGMVCGMLSAAAFAVYTVSSRKLFHVLPFRDVLMLTTLIGTLILWLAAPLAGGIRAAAEPLGALGLTDWAELAYIVLLVSLLGYALNGFGLKRLPSGIASSLTLYPQPVFAAAVQCLWLGIAPTIAVVLSALLIFGGTAIMRSSRKQPDIQS